MKRFARFTFVSGLGVVVQLTTLWLIVGAAKSEYLVATTAAVTVAVVHNFIWHRHWTWADRATPQSNSLEGLLRFAALNGLISLVGNLLAMTALVRLAGVAPLPANAVAIALCGVVNYWVADSVVFRKRAGGIGRSGDRIIGPGDRAICRSGDWAIKRAKLPSFQPSRHASGNPSNG